MRRILIVFFSLFVSCIQGQEKWFSYMPYLPKPQIQPRFNIIYQEYNELDLPDYKDPQNKSKPFKVKLSNGKFEGVFQDVPIGDGSTYYYGLKGILKFDNKDVFEGTIVFDVNKCYSTGTYTYKNGETIRFFENGKQINAREYTFPNGDKLIADTPFEASRRKDNITYWFKNGEQLKLTKYHYYDQYGAENFEFTNADGVLFKGNSIYENLPYEKWIILDHEDLYFQYYGYSEKFRGVFKKDGKWFLNYREVTYPVNKIDTFLYTFQMSNDPSTYFYFDNGVYCYLGHANVSSSSVESNGEIEMLLPKDKYVTFKGKLKNGYPFGIWSGILPAYSIFPGLSDTPLEAHFTSSGYEKLVLELPNNRKLTFQVNAKETELYTGQLFFPKGVYEGKFNASFEPDGKGTFTRNDQVVIISDYWKNDVAFKANITKNEELIRDKTKMFMKYSITQDVIEGYDISIDFTPSSQETVTLTQENKKYYTCGTCKGEGAFYLVCPGCKGKGYDFKARLVYSSGGNNYCAYCKGSGRFAINTCDICHGSGKVSH